MMLSAPGLMIVTSADWLTIVGSAYCPTPGTAGSMRTVTGSGQPVSWVVWATGTAHPASAVASAKGSARRGGSLFIEVTQS